MRQCRETMTSVSTGHIILTPNQPVGSKWPQLGSNPGPPYQESPALSTELPRPRSPDAAWYWCKVGTSHVTAAFLTDDLTGHLFTLLWPLVVIWMYKMVDYGGGRQRPLYRSEINSKIARASQIIDHKGRWLAGRGDRSTVSPPNIDRIWS